MNRILKEERGSWSLIGLLISTAIILVVIGMLYMRGNGAMNSAARKELEGTAGQPGLAAGSKKTTVPGQAMDAAKNIECRNNLDQDRKAVETYRATNTDGGFPPDLKTAGITTPSLLTCPLGGEAYQYNPANGTVRCPHAGHETF